jgi:hypothetical protein
MAKSITYQNGRSKEKVHKIQSFIVHVLREKAIESSTTLYKKCSPKVLSWNKR